MNKKKQVIFTLAGIFLVCILFMVAIISPKYFTAYTDKKLLNKMEYVNASYNAYEVTYTSFAEKVKAIGRITNSFDGISYNSVKINNIDFDYKYINKIIKKEFNDLYKHGVLQKKIRLRAKKLYSCEKYIIYPSVEKDNIKGVSFIKAVYKLKKGIVEVYIDEEYHKIYDFIIPCTLHYKDKNEKISKITTNLQSAGYIVEDLKEQQGIDYNFIFNLLDYYNFDAQENATLVTDNFNNGFIQFNGGLFVEIGIWLYTGTAGKEYFHIGINLKYKI